MKKHNFRSISNRSRPKLQANRDEGDMGDMGDMQHCSDDTHEGVEVWIRMSR